MKMKKIFVIWLLLFLFWQSYWLYYFPSVSWDFYCNYKSLKCDDEFYKHKFWMTFFPGGKFYSTFPHKFARYAFSDSTLLASPHYVSSYHRYRTLEGGYNVNVQSLKYDEYWKLKKITLCGWDCISYNVPVSSTWLTFNFGFEPWTWVALNINGGSTLRSRYESDYWWFVNESDYMSKYDTYYYMFITWAWSIRPIRSEMYVLALSGYHHNDKIDDRADIYLFYQVDKKVNLRWFLTNNSKTQIEKTTLYHLPSNWAYSRINRFWGDKNYDVLYYYDPEHQHFWTLFFSWWKVANYSSWIFYELEDWTEIFSSWDVVLPYTPLAFEVVKDWGKTKINYVYYDKETSSYQRTWLILSVKLLNNNWINLVYSSSLNLWWNDSGNWNSGNTTSWDANNLWDIENLVYFVASWVLNVPWGQYYPYYSWWVLYYKSWDIVKTINWFYPLFDSDNTLRDYYFCYSTWWQFNVVCVYNTSNYSRNDYYQVPFTPTWFTLNWSWIVFYDFSGSNSYFAWHSDYSSDMGTIWWVHQIWNNLSGSTAWIANGTINPLNVTSNDCPVTWFDTPFGSLLNWW